MISSAESRKSSFHQNHDFQHKNHDFQHFQHFSVHSKSPMMDFELEVYSLCVKNAENAEIAENAEKNMFFG